MSIRIQVRERDIWMKCFYVWREWRKKTHYNTLERSRTIHITNEIYCVSDFHLHAFTNENSTGYECKHAHLYTHQFKYAILTQLNSQYILFSVRMDASESSDFEKKYEKTNIQCNTATHTQHVNNLGKKGVKITYKIHLSQNIYIRTIHGWL